MLLVLQRVAVEAQRGDLLAGGGDQVHDAGSELGDVLAVKLHVKAQLKGLIALIHHVGKVFQRVLAGHAGADADLFHAAVPPCIFAAFIIYHRFGRAQVRAMENIASNAGGRCIV